jgi:hypothetical protein
LIVGIPVENSKPGTIRKPPQIPKNPETTPVPAPTASTLGGRWCTDQISTDSAYVAAIENSLIDHPCHTNITPLSVITLAR